ncbi:MULTISPECIES: LuxR C-terminal-related transcriptional regulator [unclassified Photorhabdus]|uniref:LuxR C-terminal-related transcriptional regulator n=1 Tax=unclassified Photorhabdus TaxID=2620880 RepID=UPI000DCCAC43|nr:MULTISPECIES: LuxR C-terminal-related transcriptional regulator [unclassified Photorhabdus]RAX02642.1 helix-turn-helix transcriptional regulator [Photorhabdus sp. S9-53]RAX02881.1 helix-turn-helix transcriptional regulator [Photorhabdus sp. S10-54]RAX05620.1 helix-turn-helix transcriptional regulator [Photorhabdus sp. S8-52]
MKNYTISPQIINTMEISNEPWGIKDSSSNFIYGNSATKKYIHNFKASFNYDGLYDHELPWDGAEFAKEFIIQDSMVMAKEQRICSVETHIFGQDQMLSSYFCEKLPFYHEDGNCIGVMYHCWEAKSYSLASLHQYYKKLPASIMLQPPSDIFTPREWDIIFFFLQKYTRQQIRQILNIAYRTIETYMAQIYNKIGIHSSQQLEEYCLANNFHHYVPEKFLLS